MRGRRRAWNLWACQNTGVSAVHLDCRPDIITPHHLAATHASTLASAAGAAVSGLVLSPRQENVLLPAVLKVTFMWRRFNRFGGKNGASRVNGLGLTFRDFGDQRVSAEVLAKITSTRHGQAHLCLCRGQETEVKHQFLLLFLTYKQLHHDRCNKHKKKEVKVKSLHITGAR